MFDDIQDLLDRHAASYMAGRMDDLAETYRLPLAFYLDDQLLLMRSREEVIRTYEDHRRRLMHMGLTGLRAEALQIELRSSPLFQFHAVWYRRFGEEESRGADVQYFARRSREGLRIEMVRISRLSLPAMKEWSSTTDQTLRPDDTPPQPRTVVRSLHRKEP